MELPVGIIFDCSRILIKIAKSDILPRLIEQNPSDFVVFPSVSEGKFKIASQFYNRNKVAES